MSPNSHKSAVANRLRCAGSITGKEAWEQFGCYRLSSVIHRLRKEGWPIHTERVGEEQYAKYVLEEIQDGSY